MSKSSKFGTRKNQRKDASFKAKDGFGQSHLIEVYTEVLASGEAGPRSYLTADGETVERLGLGRFRLIHGGLNLHLHSDDPAAL
jgi:hypothetical protein